MVAESGKIVSRKPSLLRMKVSVIWTIYFCFMLIVTPLTNTPIDFELVGGFVAWLGIIGTMSLLELKYRASIHYCHSCGIKIGKGVKFHTNPKLKVISTSQSTKAVSSISPGIALGSVGGKRAGGLTLNSTTSHVPIVLGNVEAKVKCPEETCKAINKWKFSTEVEVWTDVQDGSQTFKVVGKKKAPA